MLEIELNTNDCQIETRMINGKNGQRTIHEQQAYFHTGGAYPTPFKLSIRTRPAFRLTSSAASSSTVLKCALCRSRHPHKRSPRKPPQVVNGVINND